MAGGWLLKNRLSLYPFLVLIPWLSPRLGRRAETGGAAVLALAALLNLGYLIHGYRELGAVVDEYLAGLAPVAPNTRVLALTFERAEPTNVLSHAIAYAALEKGLVDWDNYEAKVALLPGAVPRRRRLSRHPGHPVGSRLLPRPAEPRAGRRRLLWRMPRGNPLADRLRRHYALTEEEGAGQLVRA